jgi:hypothetical protein
MGEWVTGKGGKAASAKGGRCSAGLPPALRRGLDGPITPQAIRMGKGGGSTVPCTRESAGNPSKGLWGHRSAWGWGSGVTIMILPLCNSGTRTDPSLRERECGRAHHSLRALALQGTQWGGLCGGIRRVPRGSHLQRDRARPLFGWPARMLVEGQLGRATALLGVRVASFSGAAAVTN